MCSVKARWQTYLYLQTAEGWGQGGRKVITKNGQKAQFPRRCLTELRWKQDLVKRVNNLFRVVWTTPNCWWTDKKGWIWIIHKPVRTIVFLFLYWAAHSKSLLSPSVIISNLHMNSAIFLPDWPVSAYFHPCWMPRGIEICWLPGVPILCQLILLYRDCPVTLTKMAEEHCQHMTAYITWEDVQVNS